MLESFYLRKNAARRDELWKEKRERAQKTLGQEPLRTLSPDPIGDRRRIDLMWKDGRLGLRGPTASDGTFQFIDLWKYDERPDAPSPALIEMLETLLRMPPPLQFAQLRFREGHRGQQGLWIDTSNEQIKGLLDQGTWARDLLAKDWVIEAGQKRKAIAPKDDGSLGLREATAQVWLTSFTKDNLPIPLQSTVASFSQPGIESNRALIALGMDLLDHAGIEELPWREWGAGYGNLTAAFATHLGPQGEASELEAFSAELLAHNGKAFFPKIRVSCEAAEKSRILDSPAELWLLDPPRPGFGALLKMLAEHPHKPRYILNYHCHEAGLATDTAILRELGYGLDAWSALDVFPGTAHLEAISLWRLP